MVHTTTKREQLNIRASAEQRTAIDRAAALVGKTRTDFILESALRDAQNVLLDQRVFRLQETSFDSIASLIDGPAAPNPELRDLLRESAPWN